MIDFNYLTDFIIEDESLYSDWIDKLVSKHNFIFGDITYVFCDDAYLHEMNIKFLNHDALTDIITFDYSEDTTISGDLFISIQRLQDNAVDFNTDFKNELLRVMSHGVLHLMGYKDKTEKDVLLMRSLEEEAISLFHVKQ
ncbi:MAG: rRNA maturation RNase YbeY [Flavobacterium sp.]